MERYYTKKDAVEELGLNENLIDYAIPQSFWEQAHNIQMHSAAKPFLKFKRVNPQAHFVWSYEEERICGKPVALTAEGKKILLALNYVRYTNYPIPKKVVEYIP